MKDVRPVTLEPMHKRSDHRPLPSPLEIMGWMVVGRTRDGVPILGREASYVPLVLRSAP